MAEPDQRGKVVDPGLPGRPATAHRHERPGVVPVRGAGTGPRPGEHAGRPGQAERLPHRRGHLVGVHGHLATQVEHRAHTDAVVPEQLRDGGRGDRPDVLLAGGYAVPAAQGLLADSDVEHRLRTELAGVDARPAAGLAGVRRLRSGHRAAVGILRVRLVAGVPLQQPQRPCGVREDGDRLRPTYVDRVGVPSSRRICARPGCPRSPCTPHRRPVSDPRSTEHVFE